MNTLETRRSILHENNKALRKIFGKYIKGNFLIEMLYFVMCSFPELLHYYDLSISTEKIIAGSDNYIDFDICRLIVGCHSANIIFLSDEERVKLERSTDYKKKLYQQVIQNIKLRRYSSLFFRRQPVMPGELFISYNVPYNLFTVAMRIAELVYQNKANSNLSYLYSTISNKSLAVLTLLEDNFLDNCFPICRVIIELYCKLLACKCNPELSEEFFKFTRFEISQACCEQEYPQEFNEVFNRRLNKSTTKKIDYLHYGWVDKISHYHDIVKKQPYSINGILTYLIENQSDGDNNLREIRRFYKMCHGYAHGNSIQTLYPLLNYFQVSEILHFTLFDAYKLLCDELGLDGHINGVDVYAKEDKDFSVLHSQYMQCSTENFKNHYKKKY